MMVRFSLRWVALAAVTLLLSGCQAWFLRDADREVNRLIQRRQMAALGQAHDATIGEEDGRLSSTDTMYSFVPHPVDPAVPEAFRRRRPVATQPATEFSPTTRPTAAVHEFTLSGALAYAMRHSREFQFEKEELYLTALALSLERFLWTPQFAAEVSAEFANYGQVRDFDRAMTAVAQASVQQRLPLGGDITAQVINTWMRDLGVHTTSGETGRMILEANLPLFRGAGRVAYESRYQAERNLIYAVRDFERFRRTFVVEVAREFFGLLALKSTIENARKLEEAFRNDLPRARELAESGRVLRIEAERAEVEHLRALNDVVNATATYNSALDRFKITLGMPVEQPIDVAEEELDLYEPEVFEPEAIATALRYRLDLLNDLDTIDDSRRQIEIARNNLLPGFDFRGSVTMDTDPGRKNVLGYNPERTTWRGEVALEIPVNRKEERNAYRSAWIDYRRSHRNYERGQDEVRADVRDALRELERTRISMEIQRKNIEINRFRAELARTQFEMGKLASNRDVVEAETAFTDAQNDFAEALSNYRAAILAFLRDTGTLRVGDDGRWVTYESVASAAPAGPAGEP